MEISSKPEQAYFIIDLWILLIRKPASFKFKKQNVVQCLQQIAVEWHKMGLQLKLTEYRETVKRYELSNF